MRCIVASCAQTSAVVCIPACPPGNCLRPLYCLKLDSCLYLIGARLIPWQPCSSKPASAKGAPLLGGAEGTLLAISVLRTQQVGDCIDLCHNVCFLPSCSCMPCATSNRVRHSKCITALRELHATWKPAGIKHGCRAVWIRLPQQHDKRSMHASYGTDIQVGAIGALGGFAHPSRCQYQPQPAMRTQM